MAMVGTRKNPGNGGVGLSLALGSGRNNNDFELKKQREAQQREIFNELINQGITDPKAVNDIMARFMETGQLTLPTSQETPVEGPTQTPNDTPLPPIEMPYTLGKKKEKNTRGIAFVDKAGGIPKLMESPYDEISSVDYGTAPEKPDSEDKKAEEKRQQIIAMLKGAKATGKINFGTGANAVEIPATTKQEVVSGLQGVGIDPTADPDMSALVDSFPEQTPSYWNNLWGALRGKPAAQKSDDQSAQDYLKSIGAKVTPANIAWAKSKTGKK